MLQTQQTSMDAAPFLAYFLLPQTVCISSIHHQSLHTAPPASLTCEMGQAEMGVGGGGWQRWREGQRDVKGEVGRTRNELERDHKRQKWRGESEGGIGGGGGGSHATGHNAPPHLAYTRHLTMLQIRLHMVSGDVRTYILMLAWICIGVPGLFSMQQNNIIERKLNVTKSVINKQWNRRWKVYEVYICTPSINFISATLPDTRCFAKLFFTIMYNGFIVIHDKCECKNTFSSQDNMWLCVYKKGIRFNSRDNFLRTKNLFRKEKNKKRKFL